MLSQRTSTMIEMLKQELLHGDSPHSDLETRSREHEPRQDNVANSGEQEREPSETVPHATLPSTRTEDLSLEARWLGLAGARDSNSLRNARLAHCSNSSCLRKRRRVQASAEESHGSTAPPRLNASVTVLPSLPTTIDETPEHLRMAFSFNEFANGDTQPLDSQIYKSYTESRILQQDEEELLLLPEHDDAGHVDEEDRTIDLVTEWEKSGGLDGPSSLDRDTELGDFSPQTQSRLLSQMSQQSPPPAPRFAFPQTPATAGNKRNHLGEVVSSISRTSASRTPGSAFGAALANMGPGPGMSLTQIFNATQETPNANADRSDPIYERPSPNFANETRSSPQMPSSPPIVGSRSDPLRATTEPRETYTSMKESQELRERQKKLQDDLEKLNSEETSDLDDDLTSEQRLAERRKMLANNYRQGMQGFASLTAPQRGMSSRQRTRSLLVTSDPAVRVTSGRSAQKNRVVPLIVSDEEDPGSESDSLDEPSLGLPRSSTGSQRALETENGVQVPITSSKPAGSLKVARSSPSTDTSPKRAKDSDVVKLVARSSIGPRHDRIGSGNILGTQTVAIEDSQPIPPVPGNGSTPPTEKLVIPSTQLLEPQSQASDFSSQVRRVSAEVAAKVDSSSIPQPPIDTSQFRNEFSEPALPSSPPVMHAEHSDEEDVLDDDGDNREGEAMDGAVDKEIDWSLELVRKRQQIPDDHQLLQSEVQSSEVESTTALQNEPNKSNIARRRRHTIPDSDATEHPATDTQPASKVSEEHIQARQTEAGSADISTAAPTIEVDSAMKYHTATSHITNSEKTQTSSQPAKSTAELAQPDPIRRFRSLSAVSQSPPASPQSVDLDFNVFNEDDEAYLAIMSSPPKPARPAKRVKTYGGRLLKDRLKEANPPAAPTPSKETEMKELREAPMEDAPPSVPVLEPEGMENSKVASGEDELAPGADPKGEHLCLPKKNTTSTKTPFKSPTRPTVKGKLKRISRETGLAEDNSNATGHLAKPVKAVQATPKKVLEVAETPQTKLNASIRASRDIVDRSSASAMPKESRGEPKEDDLRSGHLHDGVAQSVEQHNPQPTEGVRSEDAADDLRMTPNRVLARFSGGLGSNMAYWPATCLSFDGRNYTIRFDDGLIDHLEPNQVRSLDLQLGDLVKVDLPRMKQHVYIVSGFKDRVTAAELSGDNVFPLTDQRGYRTLVLEMKQRESLPKGPKKSAAAPEFIEVPTTNIYLTSTMWPRFKGRTYTCPIQPSFGTESRVATPALSLPGTPADRSRRPAVNSAARPISARQSIYGGTLFSKMAFAVTLSPTATAERDEITALITSYGGQILEPGFEILFNVTESPLPCSSVVLKSPKKNKLVAPGKSLTEAEDEQPSFQLKPEAASLGFVALIADKHSRRAKYMQALALGIPCLSSRWIHDCIARSRILPFPRYLLPAGESTFLGGAIRSRTLPASLASYDPVTARFANVLEQRDKLLKDASVLLVMGKSKGAEEKKKPYVFLSYALGARSVTRVKNVKAAKALLDTPESVASYDWIYVDAESLDEAEKTLFASCGCTESVAGSDASPALVRKRGAGKKRKRASAAEAEVEEERVEPAEENGSFVGLEGLKGGSDVRVGTVFGEDGVGRKLRIAGDEFVVQSLILGALVDE